MFKSNLARGSFLTINNCFAAVRHRYVISDEVSVDLLLCHVRDQRRNHHGYDVSQGKTKRVFGKKANSGNRSDCQSSLLSVGGDP